jgi:hypothetical protein
MTSMRNFALAFAASLLLPSFARAAGLAEAARLIVGQDSVAVGRIVGAAAGSLDCKTSAVQHTIQPCALKPAALPTAFSVGHRVQSVSLNVNYKGKVINMSVAYENGLGFDAILGDYKAALAASPKVQYWADDAHLYASYIWIDGETEVEISRVVKGAAQDGAVRVYVSSLAGNPDLNPDDSR